MRRGRLLEALAIGVAVLTAAAGLLVYLASAVVEDRLLTSSLYADALDEADAYGRFYREVLTDPEVLEAADLAIAQLDLAPLDPADVRAVGTAGARLLFPPPLLRAAALDVIDALLRYLRGEVDALHTVVDLGDVLARATDTIFVQVASHLAEASTRVFTDLEQYRTAVHGFADELAAGRVPAVVPVIGGRAFSVDDALAVIDRATKFGLSPRARNQVRAALESGDARAALIDAVVDYVSVHVDRALVEFASGSLGRPDVDLLVQLTDAAGVPAGTILEEVNGLRSTVDTVPGWGRPLGLGLFAAGSAVLIIVHRHRPGRAILSIAVVALVVAVGGRLGWWWAARRVDSPLRTLAGGGTPLPASVQALIADIDDRLVAHIRSAARSLAVLPIAAAAVAALLPALPLVLRRSRSLRTPALGFAVLMAVAFAVLAAVLPDRGQASAPPACNGHAELCDRPYDEVVQAAAHNAMSSPDVVDVWPHHDRGIRAQLAYGVRTLLIDTKYWERVDTPADLSSVERLLPAPLADALFGQIAARREARPGAYLCHFSCALGAIELTSALGEVREFLEQNPDEVVTLIIQNEISAADTTTAFAAAGLEPYLFTHAAGEPWPTLGELVRGGRRLVVFSENPEPAPAWNHPAFSFIQDTPYLARSPAELSCARSRGEASASLFLMNHWISRAAPDRADARLLNAREAIVARARRCAEERGQLPDFVAVDFFSLGDLMGAVDELNGVESVYGAR